MKTIEFLWKEILKFCCIANCCMPVSIDAMLNSTLEDKYFGSYSCFWVNKVSMERD